MSEFADYVEKQQALRHQPAVGPSNSGGAEADELKDILDSLDLTDDSPQVRLKDLILGEDADTLQKLVDVLTLRIEEGFSETVFDIGIENSGESMNLKQPEWDRALARLQEAATKIRCDCTVLLTRNVHGPEEATSKNEKEKGCTGKILVRQQPATPEDVIETRIAVVGNVDAGKSTMLGVLVKGGLDDGRGKARVRYELLRRLDHTH